MLLLGDRVERKPEGYAVDRAISRHLLRPGKCRRSTCGDGSVRWPRDGALAELTLLPNQTYILPSGYRVRLEKQSGGAAWRLVGAVAHGTLCHKPCTVSGGGKSEISKSISSVLLHRPGLRPRLLSRHGRSSRNPEQGFLRHLSQPQPEDRARRPILSPERSLGSVIKLLTASAEYTDEHNEWLREPAADHPPTGVHRQALLPAGMGRKLARAFHRRSHQRLPGPRAEVRQPETGRQLPARGLRSARRLAHLQAPSRFPSRRQGAGGGRYHRLRGGASPQPGRFRRQVPQSQRQAGGELRGIPVPAA